MTSSAFGNQAGRSSPASALPVAPAPLARPRRESSECAVKAPQHAAARLFAAGNDQRRLRHAIAGIKRLVAKADRRELPAKFSSVSARTGSAPLKATSQLLRSKLASWSSVTFSTHRS